MNWEIHEMFALRTVSRFQVVHKITVANETICNVFHNSIADWQRSNCNPCRCENYTRLLLIPSTKTYSAYECTHNSKFVSYLTTSQQANWHHCNTYRKVVTVRLFCSLLCIPTRGKLKPIESSLFRTEVIEYCMCRNRLLRNTQVITPGLVYCVPVGKVHDCAWACMSA